MVMVLSSGSPGTICQWWNTDRQKAWPWVWVLRSVSKPNESMAGINALMVYSGDPGTGASWVTCPRLPGDDCVQDLELDIPDGFLAQRTLACAPLETLDNALLDRPQQPLVHFRWKSVIHQNVGSGGVRSKCPN